MDPTFLFLVQDTLPFSGADRDVWHPISGVDEKVSEIKWVTLGIFYGLMLAHNQGVNIKEVVVRLYAV